MDAIKQLAAKLIELNLQLSSAESCTGGGIGHMCTALPGSSAWYKGGVIAYSNELKTNLLNVPEDILHAQGAVSEQVAHCMAQGAAEVMNSDIAISTTGIAGPEGGTEDKPVGTVCFGWAIAEKVHTETIYLTGDREQIRQQSIEHSLQRLIQLI